MKLSSLQKGLVLHMPLDQESFNPATKRFTDKSAYSNHGTGNGTQLGSASPGFQADRMGQLVRSAPFNGSNDYIDCGNAASLQITGSFSVSVWFNPTVWGNGTNGYKSIVAKFDYGQKGWFMGRAWSNTDGIDFRIYHGDGTFDGEHSSGDIEAIKGTWIHAVGVFDAGNYVKLYINGVEWDSDNTVQGSFVDADTNFLQLGRRLTTSECFTGFIADLRIYNRALSPEEVTVLTEIYRPKLVIGV